MKDLEKLDIFFEVEDVFKKRVRTSSSYWIKITTIKHKELIIDKDTVIQALQYPEEVRKSVKDPYIFLYYKRFDKKFLVVVVKYLNNHGFVVTIYKTSKPKKKGETVWQK